jgi:hypothetical protein
MAKRITKSMKRTKSIKYRSRKSRSKNNKSRGSRLYKGGRAPPSYVGSIQGEFINSNGQQLFRNPVGGIA